MICAQQLCMPRYTIWNTILCFFALLMLASSQLAELEQASDECKADAWFLRALLQTKTENFKDSTPASLAEEFSNDDISMDLGMLDVASIQNDPPYLTAGLQCALPVSLVNVRQQIKDFEPSVETAHSGIWQSTQVATDVTDLRRQHGSLADSEEHMTRPKSMQIQGSLRHVASLLSRGGGLQFHGFSPSFPRPFPPLTSLTIFETGTVQPSISNSLMWDDSGEVAPACLAQLQQLLLDAQTKPLQPIQHKEFLLALVRSHWHIDVLGEYILLFGLDVAVYPPTDLTVNRNLGQGWYTILAFALHSCQLW